MPKTLELLEVVVYNKNMSHTKPHLYLPPAERYPLTHSMLDEVLGRYILEAGSVVKFMDIMHDCGTGVEAEFVIRWGRLDRPNFQVRRETSSNILRVVGKARNKNYKLTDKEIRSWRKEEKKLLEKALNASVDNKNKTSTQKDQIDCEKKPVRSRKNKM